MVAGQGRVRRGPSAAAGDRQGGDRRLETGSRHGGGGGGGGGVSTAAKAGGGVLTWVEVDAVGHMVPLNNGAAGFFAISTLTG